MPVFAAPPSVPPTTDDAATVCVLCSQNCGLRVDVADNRIAAVRADEQNPFSNGYSCNKAYRIGYYVQNKQRLTEPLKRQPDGSYEPITWERATHEIGERLRVIQADHGLNALATLGIGGQGNHLGVLYALAFLVGSGSSWWFNALAQEKTQRALVDGWMLDAPPDGMLVGDLERSDYAILLGSNPALSQRGPESTRMLSAFKKSKSRRLVVVDPRKTETARSADRHIPIKVGTDVCLLLGIAAVIVSERLYEKGFIRDRTLGLEAITAALREVDPADMARRCEIESEVLTTVAREFAAAERAGIEIDLGLEQSRFNTLTAYLIRLIMALTGNLGRSGGGIFVGTFIPRAPRLKTKRPVAPVSGIEGIPIFSPVPMFSPNLFAEEVLRDDPGRIRAAIVDGSNPILSSADSPKTREAFRRLELSVVIEAAFTETARAADYVLPAPVNYEKWEYSAFPKPFPLMGVQVRPPVVAGPPNALPEAEIYHRIALQTGLVVPAPRVLARLAKKAGHWPGAALYLCALMPLAALKARSLRRLAPMVLFWLYETLGPTLRAPQLAAVWLMCLGVAFTRRKEIERGMLDGARTRNPVALGLRLFREAMAHPEGVVLGRGDPERHLEEILGYSDGKIRLAPEAMMPEIARAIADELQPDPDYPFVLNGGMRTHWTANTNFRDPAWRKGAGPHCPVRMNPADAEGLGVVDGAAVRVQSRTGSVELPAKVEKGVQPGHLHIPNGFGTQYPDPETGELIAAGVCINELTEAQDRDPFTGCPHFKYVRCRVEPVRHVRES
jgi:anaerobic selenocysteine-containing dehydrogenase